MTTATASDSPTLAEEFARDGAVCVRGVIALDWLQQLSAAFEELKERGQDLSGYYDAADSKEPGAGRGQTIVCDDCWRLSATFLCFLRQGPLPRQAAAVLGSRTVRLYEDLLIFKSAGAEQPTPWHQDEPQWPVIGRQMVSAWFCLDPVSGETGALRFVPGSHRGPLYRPVVPPERQADVEADAHFFEGGPLPKVDEAPDEFRVRCLERAEPGDAIFFHPRILHAALGSAPSYPRRTFSVRFLGDDVRWQAKRSVFHDWLRKIELADGSVISGERFPILCPSQVG